MSDRWRWHDMKIIMEAQDIPDGSTVTKIKGTKPYVLAHSLKVYLSDSLRKDGEVPPQPINGFFLLDGGGNINQISGVDMLVWCTDFETISHLYEIEIMELESK